MKLRTVDTKLAIDLLERYLTPIMRGGIDNGRFLVELDEVVNLLMPDVEKWRWQIAPDHLAVEIGRFLEPDLVRVEVSEWSADDQTGFTITVDYQAAMKKRANG